MNPSKRGYYVRRDEKGSGDILHVARVYKYAGVWRVRVYSWFVILDSETRGPFDHGARAQAITLDSFTRSTWEGPFGSREDDEASVREQA